MWFCSTISLNLSIAWSEVITDGMQRTEEKLGNNNVTGTHLITERHKCIAYSSSSLMACLHVAVLLWPCKCHNCCCKYDMVYPCKKSSLQFNHRETTILSMHLQWMSWYQSGKSDECGRFCKLAPCDVSSV